MKPLLLLARVLAELLCILTQLDKCVVVDVLSVCAKAPIAGPIAPVMMFFMMPCNKITPLATLKIIYSFKLNKLTQLNLIISLFLRKTFSNSASLSKYFVHQKFMENSTTAMEMEPYLKRFREYFATAETQEMKIEFGDSESKSGSIL